MVTKQGCTWPTKLALAQPLHSSPALGLHCGANENVLCGTLVVVATVAMVMTMVIVVAAATATQEVTLPRWGDAMMQCDGDEVRVYMANAGTSATAEQQQW